MKNTLNYSAGAQTLLANVNDSTNRIIINGTEIPSTDWTGTGTYTYSVEGATISIERIADDSGNIMLQKVSTDHYKLVRSEPVEYLTTTGDTKDNVTTFTSNDDDSIFNSGNLGAQSAYAWNAVSKIDSGEKHSSLFNKISTMFKNIRTIAKFLGTTDISAIGGGTVSGAISALNNSLLNSGSGYIKLPDGTMICYGSFQTPTSNFSTWGSMYACAYQLDISFPQSFIDVPSLHANCPVNQSGVVINALCTKDKITQVGIMRQTTATGMSNSINYIAVGRWK